MSDLTFFAIQQISTGRLLAQPRGRGGRGGTHVEFEDPGPPRLFNSRGAAVQALRWWVGGRVFVRHDEDGFDESWSYRPQPHRSIDDVRVVEVTMKVHDDV